MAVDVGRGMVVVKTSCCFVAVGKCCIFVVANVTVSAVIVEVAEIIGMVVAVGKERFRWNFLFKTFGGVFCWPPIERNLFLPLLFYETIKE